MTKEDISDYIYNKELPLSFIWEDGKEYYLELWNGFYYTSSEDFPFWKTDQFELRPDIYFISKNNLLFDCGKYTLTFEDCLSEFFFWFEINKHKCKEIFYY